MTSAAAAVIAGLLAPLDREMNDPSVSEILVNGPRSIFVERSGRLERSEARFDDDAHLLSALRAVAQTLGRTLDRESPILEGRLPDGSRIEAVLPPLVAHGPHVAIRRHRPTTFSLAALVEKGFISGEDLSVLEAALGDHENVLVSGGTGSGKTTLLSALASLIAPEERIVTIEDAREISIPRPHVVSLEARPADPDGSGAVGIDELFRATLRLRPDRIVIGELRGAEAYSLVQAMTSGHGGSLSTLHASSPRDALARLESMALSHPHVVPLAVLRGQIASAIDFVVQVERSASGQRGVQAIARVRGLDPAGNYRVEDVRACR